MKIELTEREAALISNLCEERATRLGERQQKPAGYTYKQVMDELTDCGSVLLKVFAEIGSPTEG